MESIQNLWEEFHTPNDTQEARVRQKLKLLLQSSYVWEEIADLYWEFRDQLHLKYENFEEIVDWIFEQRGRKAKIQLKYIGSNRNRSITSQLNQNQTCYWCYSPTNLQLVKSICGQNEAWMCPKCAQDYEQCRKEYPEQIKNQMQRVQQQAEEEYNFYIKNHQ